MHLFAPTKTLNWEPRLLFMKTLMKRFLSFFQNASENRTQFFIVMGFIILPIVFMSYVFYLIVLQDSGTSSQRLKIPPHLLEAQNQNQN